MCFIFAVMVFFSFVIFPTNIGMNIDAYSLLFFCMHFLQGNENKVRTMTREKKRVIAVSGCKGGVGKTVVATNLALAMGQLGQRVVLMDGNLDVPGVGFSLGLNTVDTSQSNQRSSEASFSLPCKGLIDGPGGIRVFTPGPEVWSHRRQTTQAVALIQGMDDLSSGLDTLVVDTAPGLAPHNMMLIQAATDVVVVISQEDVSVVDAARQIRLLHQLHHVQQFYVVVNLVSSKRSGARQFEQLQQRLKDDKWIVLNYLGVVPFDKTVSEAAGRQSAAMIINDDCRAARAFHRIAHQLAKIPVPEPKGRIEFFLPDRIKERTES